MAEKAVRGHGWQLQWVRLAVALAFADASIVVLALPQIVDRLHTSIGASVWVIVAYNLALIAGCGAVLVLHRQLASPAALVAGLALFGMASIGCGAAGSLGVLVPLRCVQGVGGALVLCASLPLFAGTSGPGQPALYAWAVAAAIGAAIGPAVGGVLTQVFDWRAIFFAQAPVAAVAAIAVLVEKPTARDELPPERAQPAPTTHRALGPVTANVALALLSAGLIGALFLVVIELINAWLVSPIGAAAIVTTIPLATALVQRFVPGRSPWLLGAAGAVLLAGGLVILAQLSHRELGPVVVALALCGIGLGLGFPALTTAALRGPGTATARAARTVAARDAGLVLGLLVLTPVFVNQLNHAPAKATAAAAGAVIIAPLPTSTKLDLAPKLMHAADVAPESQLPDIDPVFAEASANASPQDQQHLVELQSQLETIIQRTVTDTFQRPFLIAALFALLVLPLLAIRRLVSQSTTGRLSAGTSRRRRS